MNDEEIELGSIKPPEKVEETVDSSEGNWSEGIDQKEMENKIKERREM